MKQLVIIPGGFHPFHKGHKSLYDAALKAFPQADIYIAATADTSTRPFPFELKKKLAQLAGIPKERFVEVKSPFRPQEITKHYDPQNTALIYVRSEKDRDTSPQPDQTKKDGEPSYLQSIRGLKKSELQPLSTHGYMAYLPAITFGSADMTSSTEIRNKWPEYSDEQKSELIQTLYPVATRNNRLEKKVIQLFDQVLGSEQLTENVNNETQSKSSVMEALKPVLKDAVTEFKNGNTENLNDFLCQWKQISEIVDKAKQIANPLKEDVYDVLDSESCGPFDGGCLLVAKALQEIHDGKIIVLVDDKNIAQHAAVLLPNGKIADYDGVKEPKQFIKDFNKNELANIVNIRKLESGDLEGASRNFDLVPELVNTLQSKFSPDYINEMFDRPARWRIIEDTPSTKKYTASVNGKSLVVIIERFGSLWEINFTVEGKLDVTGTGDEVLVFSTVLDIIKDFIYSETPQKIEFHSELEKGNNYKDSRTKLYNRLVKKFANQYGYDLNILDDTRNRFPASIYTLTLNPDATSPDYISEESSHSEVIQEIFDKPAEIEKTKDGVSVVDGERFVRYDGFISDEQVVVFMKEIKENVWKIEFRVGGRQDARGDKSGDEIAIFSTVFSAIKQFVEERNPETLIFTALKEEFGQATNRANLYKRMVDRFANKYGYLDQVVDKGNDSVFVLKRADTVLHNTGIPAE